MTNGAAASVGLSHAHICTPLNCGSSAGDAHARVRYLNYVAVGGRMVRVRARVPVCLHPQRGRRGLTDGLSRQSRARLLRLVNSIDMDRHRRRPLFLTLTYPENWPASPLIAKRHLRALWERMRRGWMQSDRAGRGERVNVRHAAAIWRLEEQDRGAPHFHLIIFNMRYIDRHWISRAWYEVVGSGDDEHLRAGTSIEYPDYWEKAGSYVAKYIAKPAPEPSTAEPDPAAGQSCPLGPDGRHSRNCTATVNLPPAPAPDAEYSWENFHRLGRVWGVLGRAHLPTDIREYALPEWAFEAIKEVLVELRGDERRDQWHRAPYRGIWATCGPGAVAPILARAGLT